MKSLKKNLVIAVVGDHSCHKQWIKGRGRRFDLMLVYYGATNDKFKEDADCYLQTSGMFKLENIACAIEKFKPIVKEYDAVWLPDDDVVTDTGSINSLFDVFYKYDLDLAQPAILYGKVSHDITRFDPRYVLRYTNFVEMGFPVFKTGLLVEALPMFTLTRSGWGVDHLWSEKFNDRKMAIIDSVPVLHKVVKPENGGISCDYYAELKRNSVDCLRELEDLVREYGLKCVVSERGCVKADMRAVLKGQFRRICSGVRFRLASKFKI